MGTGGRVALMSGRRSNEWNRGGACWRLSFPMYFMMAIRRSGPIDAASQHQEFSVKRLERLLVRGEHMKTLRHRSGVLKTGAIE